MTDLPFVLDENQPTCLIGLGKIGLGTVRQQRVVEGLEERLDVLQSSDDGARCQIQPPQAPRGQLSLDGLMAKVFAQQDLDPDRPAIRSDPSR